MSGELQACVDIQSKKSRITTVRSICIGYQIVRSSFSAAHNMPLPFLWALDGDLSSNWDEISKNVNSGGRDVSSKI